jgi:hypothetical protein
MLRAAFALALAGTLLRATARAQAPVWITVGSPAEEYLRVADLAGVAPRFQVASRFLRDSTGKLPGQAQHPWKPRWSAVPGASRRFAILATETRTIFNSSLPFGFNDGALWVGRGLTQSVQGGFAVRAGSARLVLQPLAFWAQNQSFPMEPPGMGQAFIYTNPIGSIDAPQRFGPRSYARIDPGQSTLEVSVGPASVGLSTANDIWGPAFESPMILGNNAPGIPRLFVGTERPVDVWIGAIHGRVFWGRSTLSPYVGGTFGGRRKFVTGMVGSIVPRGAPNLTLGAARFFHVSADRGYPEGFFTKVLQGLVQTSLATASNPLGDDPTDNQLASLFVRWSFPSVGFEVFGEVGREDTSYDLRDLLLQLYHDAGYLLGMQRVWRSADSTRFTALRAELLNTRIGPLYQAAPQLSFYVHDVKGHTERGQVLGAPYGVGGGSFMTSVTRYAAQGSTRFRMGRLMVRESVNSSNGPVPDQAGVIGEIGVSRMRFGSGRRPDITTEVTLSRHYGRPEGQRFNLTLGLTTALPR